MSGGVGEGPEGDGLVGGAVHEELDAAVLDAYGWHDNPDDETLLERLVALNAERAAEEANGTIRWLRPAFQSPDSAPAPAAATLARNRAASSRFGA